MTDMFQGIGVMASVAVICMLVVLVAMIVDFISGWRKAKQRGEARTSYGDWHSRWRWRIKKGNRKNGNPLRIAVNSLL